MPGERREFIADPLPEKVVIVRYQVKVIPDYFYKGTYQSLIDGGLTETPMAHIRHAFERAEQNDYLLYEKELMIRARSYVYDRR